MKASSSIILLTTLVAAARAGGSVDMQSAAASIASQASGLSGNGQYSFTNVQTGQVLSFIREGGLTNLYPMANGGALDVEFNSDGQMRLSGANCKCMSAQWDAVYEGGVDYAAVSYACSVGSNTCGTGTLEWQKQWWYAVPVSSGSSSSSSSSSSSDDVSFAAKTEKVASAAAAPAASAVSHVAAAAAAVVSPQTSSSTASSDSKKVPATQLDTTSSSDSSDSSAPAFNVNDRSTWVCQHDGVWLARHPAYITDAVPPHPECQRVLDAYNASLGSSKRLIKRVAAPTKPNHHDMAMHLKEKRASQAYYIIPFDHIYDMATRAVQGEQFGTFGGYTSTRLELWNQGDASQQWIITPA